MAVGSINRIIKKIISNSLTQKGDLGMDNLFAYIKEYAANSPNKIAIIEKNRIINYQELFNCIINQSAKLKKMGFYKQQRVLLKYNRQSTFIINFLSLLEVGCWVIPIPSEITDDELEKIVNLTKGVKLPVEDFTPEVYNSGEEQGVWKIADSENTGIYHLTSGSTGTPKFCVRTLKALTLEGLSFKKTFDISDDDIILSMAPLNHSFALGATIMTALVSGAGIYTMDNFTPRLALKEIQTNKITILVLVPAIAGVLCDVTTKKNYDLKSLRIVLAGAGSINGKLYYEFQDKFGISLMSNYGSTETGGIVSRLEPLPYESIGKPMMGVEIKICDANGRKIINGQAGELRVKCKSMLNSYWLDPKLPFDEDGYLPMGDIAKIDEKGYLFIMGRIKSIINVSGKKVNPFEVEEILLEHSKISECVVRGIKKSNGDEAVRAFIVSNNLTEEEIRNYCQIKLSSYKVPSEIIFLKALPRNKTGKIKWEELQRN